MPPAVPALNPDEVQVGAANGPGLWIAPVGTSAPADTTTAFASPWMILGYASEDGATVGSSSDSTDLVPWQSVAALKSVITSRTITIQFTLWQLNRVTLGLYFDQAPPTETEGAIDMEVRSDSPQQLYAVAVDSRDGDRVLRVIFGRCSLSSAGDMAINRGAAVPLDITLSALDDAGVLANVQLGPAEAGGAPLATGRKAA